MTEVEMKAKFATYIEGVELNDRGEPKILARWGYIKVKFKEKVYLAAASPDECREILAEHGIDDPHLMSICLGGGQDSTVPCSCYGQCGPLDPYSGWVCPCSQKRTTLSWERVR